MAEFTQEELKRIEEIEINNFINFHKQSIKNKIEIEKQEWYINELDGLDYYQYFKEKAWVSQVKKEIKNVHIVQSQCGFYNYQFTIVPSFNNAASQNFFMENSPYNTEENKQFERRCLQYQEYFTKTRWFVLFQYDVNYNWSDIYDSFVALINTKKYCTLKMFEDNYFSEIIIDNNPVKYYVDLDFEDNHTEEDIHNFINEYLNMFNEQFERIVGYELEEGFSLDFGNVILTKNEPSNNKKSCHLILNILFNDKQTIKTINNDIITKLQNNKSKIIRDIAKNRKIVDTNVYNKNHGMRCIYAKKNDENKNNKTKIYDQRYFNQTESNHALIMDYKNYDGEIYYVYKQQYVKEDDLEEEEIEKIEELIKGKIDNFNITGIRKHVVKLERKTKEICQICKNRAHKKDNKNILTIFKDKITKEISTITMKCLSDIKAKGKVLFKSKTKTSKYEYIKSLNEKQNKKDPYENVIMMADRYIYNNKNVKDINNDDFKLYNCIYTVSACSTGKTQMNKNFFCFSF